MATFSEGGLHRYAAALHSLHIVEDVEIMPELGVVRFVSAGCCVLHAHFNPADPGFVWLEERLPIPEDVSIPDLLRIFNQHNLNAEVVKAYLDPDGLCVLSYERNNPDLPPLEELIYQLNIGCLALLQSSYAVGKALDNFVMPADPFDTTTQG